MSPTANSGNVAYGYLDTPAHGEIPGQRCPATWLQLHVRVASRPPAEIASEGPVMCLLATEADGLKPNPNVLRHSVDQPSLRNLLVDIGDAAIPTTFLVLEIEHYQI